MTTTLDAPVPEPPRRPRRAPGPSKPPAPPAIRTAPVPRAPAARGTVTRPAGAGTGPGRAVTGSPANAAGHRVRKVRLGGPEGSGLRAAAEALDGRPAPEPDPDLPDPTGLVCRVVRAAVEVLRGERPAAQLARWVTPDVFDQLQARGRLTQQSLPPGPPSRPASVRRVRLVRIGDTSAEATVVVEHEGRFRAAAVRVEARRGTWRVACLEIA